MAKILVVDDDESIVDSITLILEDAGYRVDSTLSGDEAYNKIKSFIPNLILLDILLSGVDGRDICKKLKKDTEAVSIIKKGMLLKGLLKNNNLNPQLTIDSLLIFIKKQLK